ncbi:MAG: metallophosphoesterase family protein [bacterium]|nr:metallophosphoesterase family protein [bacterium]
MTPRWLLIGLSAVIASLSAPALADPVVERSPYLMVSTPDSVVVRWRTDIASESVVRYGASHLSLTNTVSETGPTTEHEVEITGLSPSTTWFYSVGTSTLTLAGGDTNHFFKTSPLKGTREPIRIWVIGDSGQCAVSSTGCTDANAVKNKYLNHAGSNLADVWLILGDNAYPSGTDTQFTDGFFDVYPEVMRNTPLFPTLGNHELGASSSASQSGPYYDSYTMPTGGQAGGVASGTEAYYSFDHGNVHFISIDSATQGTNLTVGGPMYNWLELDLMANDQDFTIIFWHHPPYTKGSHDSDNSGEISLFEMRQNFNPLIEAWGVDLQLTGHSHSYERSVLIDGHYGLSSECGLGECFVDGGDGDPNSGSAYQKATLGSASHEGTVYAVVGSSSKNNGVSQHPVMSYWLSFEGSMLIDVDGSTLDAIFIDKLGAIRDHFRIEKPPAALPVPTFPKSPWFAIALLLAVLASLSLRGVSRRSAR